MFSIDGNKCDLKKLNFQIKGSRYVAYYDNEILTISTIKRFGLLENDINSICIKSNAYITKFSRYPAKFTKTIGVEFFDKNDCEIFKDQLISILILKNL